MLSEFIDRIIEIQKPAIIDLDSRKYSTSRIYEVKNPVPNTFQIRTLTGIKDYFEKNADRLAFGEVVIIVENFDKVLVTSALYGNFLQRNEYIVSKQFENKFRFDSYYDVEEFIIQLQTNFERTDHLLQILSIIGNLKEENVKNTSDDGVTQTVTAKSGISLAKEVNLPNPVSLKPYRTFLEVDQPESQFVFRMKSGPVCGLFEADGGKWKLTAIENIRDWLAANLPKDVTIIA
jgi:hypothetical protein